MTIKDRNTLQYDRNSPIFEDMPKVVGRAYDYLLQGLTAKEIGKLLDVSFRTVQRWKAKYHFKELASIPDPETETIPQRAVRLSAAGLSYSQIGRKLKRSKATIYNYLKAEKERRAKQPETIPDVYQPLFDFLNSEFDLLPLRSEMDSIIRLAGEVSIKKMPY